MTEDLIDIVKKVKEKITDDSDMSWTGYDSAKELRDELAIYLQELQTGNINCMEQLKILFLPTATLQEHSISNGWADEYLSLSQKFDTLYAAKKSS